MPLPLRLQASHYLLIVLLAVSFVPQAFGQGTTINCTSLVDCNSCLNQTACGWCGNLGSRGICFPGTASGSAVKAANLPYDECPLAQWRKDACFSFRSSAVISKNNIEIIDYLQGPSGGKMQVIDAVMTPADATVPKNLGLWAIGVRMTGTGGFPPTGKITRDLITDMSVTVDVSAVGLIAVAEYFNPDGVSPYQCPDWGVDRDDTTQSCRTHITRTDTNPSDAKLSPIYVANPITGENVTSVQSSSESGRVTIRVNHVFAKFECTFYTTAQDPFTVSCEATQYVFEPSTPQASLVFIFGGLRFSTFGAAQSFANLDEPTLQSVVDKAFANQQTVVDPSFFRVKNDSNLVIKTVNGPRGVNETVPYLCVSVLNPNRATAKRAKYYVGDVKSSVYLTGPSVLIGPPRSKKTRTPIIIASVIIVTVILLIAAVIIVMWIKYPEKFPSFIGRKTEESAQYSLYT